MEHKIPLFFFWTYAPEMSPSPPLSPPPLPKKNPQKSLRIPFVCVRVYSRQHTEDKPLVIYILPIYIYRAWSKRYVQFFF